ncbi:Transforming growth factor-beta receptor-associated protein 1 [Folsomia candida]|uniref:Transforming growth factor-beta receptor-associated protein 1 n=1 Tax=Folsomia candida TaxID=158441 RepID=A0A226F676_FOLCA|nr:Transforming growth factor-beta receptor-associated protein 1 [Folsomia candida]
MEVSAPKIYDIQLVINSIEVEGNVAKVLCVECCGTRMFLGTAEGYLLEYFITDQKSKTFFNRVRLVNINKGQPIVQIRNASALDTLITLSGGTLAMCDSQTMEPKGSSISSVSCFAVDDNPIDGDPFSVSLCFVKKKSIIVAQASETGFNIVKDISLDALTISLAIESGLCCVGLATGKYIIVNTMAQRKTMQDLCEFDPKEVLPKVVHVGKVSTLIYLNYNVHQNLIPAFVSLPY